MPEGTASASHRSGSSVGGIGLVGEVDHVGDEVGEALLDLRPVGPQPAGTHRLVGDPQDVDRGAGQQVASSRVVGQVDDVLVGAEHGVEPIGAGRDADPRPVGGVRRFGIAPDGAPPQLLEQAGRGALRRGDGASGVHIVGLGAGEPGELEGDRARLHGLVVGADALVDGGGVDEGGDHEPHVVAGALVDGDGVVAGRRGQPRSGATSARSPARRRRARPAGRGTATGCGHRWPRSGCQAGSANGPSLPSARR